LPKRVKTYSSRVHTIFQTLAVTDSIRESHPYGKARRYAGMVVFGHFPEKCGSMQESAVCTALRKRSFLINNFPKELCSRESGMHLAFSSRGALPVGFVAAANPNCSCEAIPYSCRPKTSWPSTVWTLFVVLSCRARYAGSFSSRVSCADNGRFSSTVWIKTFVSVLTIDRESMDRCFLYACYGNR
jgi:hypothetical protein